MAIITDTPRTLGIPLLLACLTLIQGCLQQPQPTKIEFSTEDPMFQQPYIDIDETRDDPVRHRYVHGGFTGTDTRFSFYFPPKEQYEGRFFQYITPVPDSENLSQGKTGEEDKIGFAIDSGAYFVETNGGGNVGAATPGADIDPAIGAYLANAAAAQYSRTIALQMYGGERPYGYAFGGSGGAFRTIGGMENTRGVWDGAVPYVVGTPMSIPSMFTVRTYAMRVLEDKLPAIADAVDAGSERDPFTDIGLNDEERGALLEATRLGFPLRGWHAWDHLGLHAFALLFPAIVMADPAYFEDFWTKPGYEGYEPGPSLKKALIDHTTSVEKLIYAEEAIALGLEVGHLPGQRHGLADDAWKAMQGKHGEAAPVALKLASAPEQNTLGADLSVSSGEAAGSKLPFVRLENDIVLLAPDAGELAAKLEAGDQVHFDNRNFLAVQTYHRHQVPDAGYPVWDQFRDAQGDPKYPQRPVLWGPIFTKGASGTLQSGKFEGKMILVENLYDTEAFPWQGDWYRARVEEHLGADTDEHFRLWFTDHANHGDSARQKDPLHTVSYLGVLQQALRDLAAWVEDGTEPPANTGYSVVDGQVEVADSAAERQGIQPVVSVTANGGSRSEVKTGEQVELAAVIAVPEGTGQVVAAAWDLDGSGEFSREAEFTTTDAGQASVKLKHSWSKAGTWFPTLRVSSQRQGDAETPYTRIHNLGRARVIVR